MRWIADVYRDEREIKSLGQTIVYLLHEDIGHLGIFVSGKVAKKEHSEIANTLDMIESVAPGLYEMVITSHEGDEDGEWQVELVERTIAQVKEVSGEAENEAFPAVAQISELNQHLYDVLVSPVIRQFSTEMTAAPSVAFWHTLLAATATAKQSRRWRPCRIETRINKKLQRRFFISWSTRPTA